MTGKLNLFMRNLLKLFILKLLLISFAFSTTFNSLSLKKQLNEIDGVIRGVYRGETYKRTDEGLVITEASFSIIESSGIPPSKIINKNDFRVNFSGGKYQGIVYHVIGSPTFKKNEEVVLLLKKVGGLFFIYNLSQGKFFISTKNKKEFLVSNFLKKANGGDLALLRFNKLLKKRFGSPLTSFNPDTYVYKRKSFFNKRIPTATTGRSPASVKEKSENSENGKTSVYWLLLIFTLLGLFSLTSFGSE